MKGPSPTRAETTELLKLALPLVAGFAGNQLMGIVDTAMVGRLGALELSAMSVGIGVYALLTMFGMGVVMGMDPLVAQALGAGEAQRARRVFSSALRLGLWLSLPLTAGALLLPFMLGAVGVQDDIAASALWYLVGRAGAIVPFMAFAAYRGYLQAAGMGRAIVYSALIGNVANFVANAVLIFGDASLEAIGVPGIGLPALGVLGAGLASTIATVAQLGFLWRVAKRADLAAAHAVDEHDVPVASVGTPPTMTGVWRYGLPIGLTILAEVGAFALATFLAGGIGPVAGAAHQVALTIASFSFTVTLGIGAATAVRVGRAVGKADPIVARAAGTAGLATSAAVMLVSALLFVVIPEPLVRTMTNDVDVLRVASGLLLVAAVFQLGDGAQAVASGALRGIGDTKFVQYANVVGHYAIGIPVAYTMAYVADLGVTGLWWGLCVGLSAVATSLIARFYLLTSRPLARA